MRALWLTKRSVCMRVCKHGCGVKMSCCSRANHAMQERIWKSFRVQNSTSLFYLPISSSAETWKIVAKKVCQFFFSWADILCEKNQYFGNRQLCKPSTSSQVCIIITVSNSPNPSLVFYCLNNVVTEFQ